MINESTTNILLVQDTSQDAEQTLGSLRKNNLVNEDFVVEDGAVARDLLFGKGNL